MYTTSVITNINCLSAHNCKQKNGRKAETGQDEKPKDSL